MIAPVRRHNRDIFTIFFNMKVHCIFSLESPHRVYTQYTIFIIKKKKNTPDYSKFAAMGFFSYGLKHEFDIAVVNEPSVFESLKFYCILLFPCEAQSFLISPHISFSHKASSCNRDSFVSCMTIWLSHSQQKKVLQSDS